MQRMGYGFLPPLGDVALYILRGRPGDQHVGVVPRMRRGTEIRAAPMALEWMRGRVPPVEVAIVLHRRIDAAEEGDAAINDRAFLVQGLRQMEWRATVLIQPALHTHSL